MGLLDTVKVRQPKPHCPRCGFPASTVGEPMRPHNRYLVTRVVGFDDFATEGLEDPCAGAGLPATLDVPTGESHTG